MQEMYQVRRATLTDAEWIVDLSARVQSALTASGSLQQIGPLPFAIVGLSIRGGYAYLLEGEGRRIGSTLVDPLDGRYVSTCTITAAQWTLPIPSAPRWYLHALMLDPSEQGKGLGLTFLEGVKRLALPERGTIILDCWAGNTKLRAFYQRAGFSYQGDVPVKDYEVAVFTFSSPISEENTFTQTDSPEP